MANSDKNILITPNISSSTDDPKIVFTGANTAGAYPITVKAYPINNGTISIEGSAGQLFSVTNSFAGTIFSVNDISGVPSIEVEDTGDIRLAQYSGEVYFRDTKVIDACGTWVGGGGASPAGPGNEGVVFGKTATYSNCTGLGGNASLGFLAGYCSQQSYAVAIGQNAGRVVQGACAVAVGTSAAECSQGSGAVAVGHIAGNCLQGTRAVAIGPEAGMTCQANYAIAIGTEAGKFAQGAYAIAIGASAGGCCQPSNSIVINASGCYLNSCGTGRTYIAPIRNAAGTSYLHYNSGTKEVSYSAGAPSDATLKENIQVLGCALNKTSQLRGVSFNWKACGLSDIGVIAQEVEAILPELVSVEDGGLRSVKYQNIVAVLIEAVKELKTRVETLENKL